MTTSSPANTEPDVVEVEGGRVNVARLHHLAFTDHDRTDHERELRVALQDALTAISRLRQPIDVIAFCPACSEQHVDAPSATWTNPPHRTHQCQRCGWLWRVSDSPTNGVASLRTAGQRDDGAAPLPMAARLMIGATLSRSEQAVTRAAVDWANGEADHDASAALLEAVRDHERVLESVRSRGGVTLGNDD